MTHGPAASRGIPKSALIAEIRDQAHWRIRMPMNATAAPIIHMSIFSFESWASSLLLWASSLEFRASS